MQVSGISIVESIYPNKSYDIQRESYDNYTTTTIEYISTSSNQSTSQDTYTSSISTTTKIGESYGSYTTTTMSTSNFQTTTTSMAYGTHHISGEIGITRKSITENKIVNYYEPRVTYLITHNFDSRWRVDFNQTIDIIYGSYSTEYLWQSYPYDASVTGKYSTSVILNSTGCRHVRYDNHVNNIYSTSSATVSQMTNYNSWEPVAEVPHYFETINAKIVGLGTQIQLTGEGHQYVPGRVDEWSKKLSSLYIYVITGWSYRKVNYTHSSYYPYDQTWKTATEFDVEWNGPVQTTTEWPVEYLTTAVI